MQNTEYNEECCEKGKQGYCDTINQNSLVFLRMKLIDFNKAFHNFNSVLNWTKLTGCNRKFQTTSEWDFRMADHSIAYWWFYRSITTVSNLIFRAFSAPTTHRHWMKNDNAVKVWPCIWQHILILATSTLNSHQSCGIFRCAVHETRVVCTRYWKQDGLHISKAPMCAYVHLLVDVVTVAWC